MKRGAIILISTIMAFFAGSCSNETELRQVAAEMLTIRLDIDDIFTGMQAATRGTIPAEPGEKTINDLYLFFYEYKSDGSGEFVKFLTEEDLNASPVMNSRYDFAIDLAGNDIPATGDYVILALANVKGSVGVNGYLGGESIDGFTGLLTGLTEKQAVEQTTVTVRGADADEADDTKAIAASNLLMSARAVRMKTDREVAIKLTRGVSRFDVYMGDDVTTKGYELVSASIWGAASTTPVWYDKMTTIPDRIKRFYGLKNITGNRIVGGLYAFENFVSNPTQNDQVTTCLILGLKKGGTVYYYRVNVSPDETSQNLGRNHVYRLRINDATEDEGRPTGADNEYNAWSQSRSLLNVSVNAWDLDDNSMVLIYKDEREEYTMVMPVKLVRLDPLGDVREYTVHTIGEKTLSISKKSLPDGIRAKLIGGSLLRVTADPIGQGDTERRGSIELSYGELRGSISFIQTPDESIFLELSRYEVPNHLPLGRGGIPDNVPLSVTASGPWTATIYNMDQTDPGNPGFSFSPSGAPVTTLKSAQNPFGNSFQIYTTGDNMSNSASRNGFVVITLDEDPANYSRVVVLTQETKQEITVTPALPKTIRFSAAGTPNGLSGVTADEGYTFDINPGMSNGVTNGWSISSADPDAAFFEVTKITAPINRFTIKTIGANANGTPQSYPYANRYMNLSSEPLQAVYSIYLDGSSTAVASFTVVQDKMGISVSTRGTEVPKAGGQIQDVTVNIGEGLHWKARITSNFTSANANVDLSHAGYLLLGNTKQGAEISEEQSPSTKLSVGFDKLYYPLTGESPKVTVRVSLAENEDFYTDFTVTQEALTASPIRIFDLGGSWGNLTGGDHYFTYFRDYMNNRTMFGANGKVTATNGNPTATAKAYNAALSVIEDSYNYVHLSRPARFDQPHHTVVNEWWERMKGEGLLVYTGDTDSNNDNIFLGSTRPDKRTTVLSTLEVRHSESPGRATFATGEADKPVYKYLTGDGPAGTVATSGVDIYTDGPRSAANAASMPPNAVPVLMQGPSVSLFVDPQNNLIFIGDCVLFYSGADYVSAANAASKTWGGNAATAARSKFLVNLLAYVHNAAQYGSHFTDLFVTSPEAIARVQQASGDRTPAQLYEDAFLND